MGLGILVLAVVAQGQGRAGYRGELDNRSTKFDVSAGGVEKSLAKILCVTLSHHSVIPNFWHVVTQVFFFNEPN